MSAIIQIQHLSFSIAGTRILQDISLQAEAGEYLSIIGPNGAGKTTLIKCLAGIYTDWTGKILIDGQDSAALNHRETAKLQSYVPQSEGRSSPLTVEEFTATGRYPHLSAFTSMKAEDFSALDEALRRTGMQALRKRRMNSLSGGERQMAFIAAALAQDSKILLLDEPATFLDYRHQAEVSAILRAACREQERTIIAVHHDINTAAACSSRVAALKEGSVIFSGTPAEATDPLLLQEIYDTPFISAFSDGRALPLIIPGGPA